MRRARHLGTWFPPAGGRRPSRSATTPGSARRSGPASTSPTSISCATTRPRARGWLHCGRTSCISLPRRPRACRRPGLSCAPHAERIVPIKRFTGPAGRLVVLTHTSKVLEGQSARRSVHAAVARLAAAAVRRPQARPPPLPGAVRPGRLHGQRGQPHRTGGAIPRTCPSAPRGSSSRRRWRRRSSSFPTASPRSAATSTSTRRRSAATPTT